MVVWRGGSKAMHVEIIETTSLGNRGYLIHDGDIAVAVDVQRDYSRWLDKAAEKNVTITHVLETHIHNDYVTGGYMLSQKVGAAYVIPAGSVASFEAIYANDGDVYMAGVLSVVAHHTPGHTPHHMSYEVSPKDSAQPPAICTGGGLLFGTVGRPDLISKEMTQPLAAAQYDSAHKLKQSSRRDSEILPTHGFGSFCSSSPGSGASRSTIEEELKLNIAFTSKDKQAFVDTIIAGLEPYPRYYAHMGPANLAGPGDMELQPIKRIDKQTLRQVIADEKTWVIDLRTRQDYTKKHLQGSYNFEFGDSFATYVGWIVPWGEKLVLLGASDDEVEQAQIQLGRIGMDTFVQQAAVQTSGMLSDDKASNVSSLPRIKYADVREEDVREGAVSVLDVRATSEHNALHINGAINIPFHDVLERIDELDKKKQLLVHCASGYRASVAASILHTHGHEVTFIDDDFEHAPASLLKS